MGPKGSSANSIRPADRRRSSVGSGHHFIPPGACTWQGDVETVHRLQEDEFFDRETFRGLADFWGTCPT
jgi:hypothetical protein